MYVELFIRNKAYRGVLVSDTNSNVTLKSLPSNDIVTVELSQEYTMYIHEEEGEQFSYIIEHINALKDETIFTVEDVDLITNSYNVVERFQILHSLRSLGFKFNALEEITAQALIENLKTIIEREYVSNIEYINTDDELTTEERQNLVNAINRAKLDYYRILQVTDSITEILDTFPPMFNETLPYISDITYYIKRNEEIANNIRTTWNPIG